MKKEPKISVYKVLMYGENDCPAPDEKTLKERIDWVVNEFVMRGIIDSPQDAKISISTNGFKVSIDGDDIG